MICIIRFLWSLSSTYHQKESSPCFARKKQSTLYLCPHLRTLHSFFLREESSLASQPKGAKPYTLIHKQESFGGKAREC